MSAGSQTRRVVVTGVAVVSPLGNSKQSLWDALHSGRSGVSATGDFAGAESVGPFAGRASEFTAGIDDFGDLEKVQKKMIRKGLKLMCRETMMGVAVAQRALQDAKLDANAYSPERSGCVFGSDYMLTMPEDFVAGIVRCSDCNGAFDYQRWGGEGMSHVTPLWLLKYLPNMPASHVAIYNDLRGPNNSLTLREAAGNAAIAEAAFTIARGHADMMLAGSTGTRIHPMNALHAIQQEETASGSTSPEAASRPFDLHRTGVVLGEGAGAVLLEQRAAAEARGATIYGEVVARATSSVAASGAVADRRQALQNVLASILRSVEIAPHDVGHIHAHGISTRSGDVEEAQAIAAVWGDAPSTPVTAAKSYFGNLGAGSGIVELIASLLALQHQHLFPVRNFETPDPDCPIHVARDDDTAPGRNFINLSVTPQGQASAVMIRA